MECCYCYKEISPRAAVCPYCGEPEPNYQPSVETGFDMEVLMKFGMFGFAWLAPTLVSGNAVPVA
jgi:hypothetical protein